MGRGQNVAQDAAPASIAVATASSLLFVTPIS
jgi:hypothetical protein